MNKIFWNTKEYGYYIPLEHFFEWAEIFKKCDKLGIKNNLFKDNFPSRYAYTNTQTGNITIYLKDVIAGSKEPQKIIDMINFVLLHELTHREDTNIFGKIRNGIDCSTWKNIL